MSYDGNLYLKIVMACCAVVLWAWLFTTLIGILELICLIIGLAIAYLRLEPGKHGSPKVELEGGLEPPRIISYRKPRN